MVRELTRTSLLSSARSWYMLPCGNRRFLRRSGAKPSVEMCVHVMEGLVAPIPHYSGRWEAGTASVAFETIQVSAVFLSPVTLISYWLCWRAALKSPDGSTWTTWCNSFGAVFVCVSFVISLRCAVSSGPPCPSSTVRSFEISSVCLRFPGERIEFSRGSEQK